MAGNTQLSGEHINPVVGVLALQGDHREHIGLLTAMGVAAVPLRHPEQLSEVHAVILPGGESTVIAKLAQLCGLWEPLRAAIAAGMPTLGTCAGLILLADRITNAAPGQRTLGGLDVTVERNAFGTQAESFETALDMPAVSLHPVSATFIRGPVIQSVGPKATILASLPGGQVVAVQQDTIIGISFHPELDGETRVHEHLMSLVVGGAR